VAHPGGAAEGFTARGYHAALLAPRLEPPALLVSGGISQGRSIWALEALDLATFHAQREAQAFAMHWTANGLCYGIRHSELHALDEGRWVFVNGSRQWLDPLLARWPAATVVHIGAAPDVLAQRLSARGRESAQEVAARLARHVPLTLPAGSICIDNSGTLQEAVAALRQALDRRRTPTEITPCAS
jgi:phosphonate metabolism protein PhnN/1,5-bisphosphokinase (PRPP-forming)